tara:strand:+ start:633 stop:938 length:306 start_codon:yes stop_codon:yes gene_type:complete
MAKIEELIGLTVDKNPTEFQAVAEQILGERAVAMIEAKRRQIAESIYNQVDEDSITEEEIQEIEEDLDEESDEEVNLDEEDLQEIEQILDEEEEDDSEEDA